jgi:hypothetical protein
MTRPQLLLAVLLAFPALAEDAPAAPAPEPAAAEAPVASVEGKAAIVIVDTIKMTTDGKFDEWMDKHCDPAKCDDAKARGGWKSYQLQSAQKYGGACLLAEDTVDIVRWQGNLEADGKARAYVKCTKRQLPVPVGLVYDAEKGQVFVSQLSF